jgi:hypothetical protein
MCVFESDAALAIAKLLRAARDQIGAGAVSPMQEMIARGRDSSSIIIVFSEIVALTGRSERRSG